MSKHRLIAWCRIATLLLCGVCPLLAGCASSRTSLGETSTPPTMRPGESSFPVLAGEWEYEEGTAVIELILDRAGCGTYEYKGGRFETTSLIGQEWRGRWIQSENDREGEFVVQLTPDFQEGDGRWWYTRIGRVVNPPDKGGGFHLSRNGDVPDPQTKTTSLQP